MVIYEYRCSNEKCYRRMFTEFLLDEKEAFCAYCGKRGTLGMIREWNAEKVPSRGVNNGSSRVEKMP
jgi:hypothetical protein